MTAVSVVAHHNRSSIIHYIYDENGSSISNGMPTAEKVTTAAVLLLGLRYSCCCCRCACCCRGYGGTTAVVVPDAVRVTAAFVVPVAVRVMYGTAAAVVVPARFMFHSCMYVHTYMR